MLEMPDSPDEVIFEILSRLPVVSLYRFRCVSKPWCSLISSPHFIRSHLDRSTNNKKHEHLALCCAVTETLYSLDFEWSPSGGEVLVKPPIQLDLDCGIIWGSCDGLLLITPTLDGKWVDVPFSLVNPSTRECRRLPPSPFVLDTEFRFGEYGFGYDSKSDDYKVVLISCEENSLYNVVSVYSLRTDSWKQIENYPYNHSWVRYKSGVLVNGAVHWSAETSTGNVIVALDLADEKFRIIPYTGSIDVLETVFVLGGCLCVFGKRFDDDREDLWVMKEYGVNASWTKFTITNGCPKGFWIPLSLSRTGQVLFQGNVHSLLLFDQQEGTSRRLVVHGLPTPTNFQAETYVESLVSPNRQ